MYTGHLYLMASACHSITVWFRGKCCAGRVQVEKKSEDIIRQRVQYNTVFRVPTCDDMCAEYSVAISISAIDGRGFFYSI